MIDHGRDAVAAVEDAAFGGTVHDEAIDRRALEQALEGVVDGPWWRSCGPRVEVVVPRRGARSSSARECGSGVEVRLTDEQLTIATLVHELAHALAGIDAGHGPWFRAAHVDITAVVGGTAIAAALRLAYRDFDLDVAARTWPAPFRALGDGFVVGGLGADSPRSGNLRAQTAEW